MKDSNNEWGKFFFAIKTLALRGFKKPAPVFYFSSVILIAGGTGFWYPFISNGKPDINSAMTYVFALLAAVVADFFTTSRDENFLKNWSRIEKDFTLLVVSFVVLITSFCVVSVILASGLWAWLFMTVSAILVWFLWWVLLEPQKFGIDITQDKVKSSTIGTANSVSPSNSKPKNIDELRTKLNKGVAGHE